MSDKNPGNEWLSACWHAVVGTKPCQVSEISNFRFADFQLPISRFHDREGVILRYPMLSVLTCKAVTGEISPLPGVFDARADSPLPGVFDWFMAMMKTVSWRRTLTRGDVRQWQSWFIGPGNKDLLSVFTCKAITWEISHLPGVSTTEGIRNDDEEQGFPTMTELVHGTEEQLSVFTCKAITWRDAPSRFELSVFNVQSHNTIPSLHAEQTWREALSRSELSVLTCKAITRSPSSI